MAAFHWPWRDEFLSPLSFLDDVGAALLHAGMRATAITDVTAVHFPAYRRATFRVVLDTGETVKARCFADAPAAYRQFEVRGRLPAAFVPVLAVHGRVLLERWIAGDVVGSAPSAEVVADAARVLANLHRMPADGTHMMYDVRLSEWRHRTDAGLCTLREAGMLTGEQTGQLARAAGAEVITPDVPVVGHFDFCGENMIIDESGRLNVVDNERVGLGPLRFDLARVWYRWNLPNASWTSFQHAYTAATGRPEPFAHFDFWRIAVLVQSACIRLASGDRIAAIPFDRLKAFAPLRQDAVP